MSTRSYIAKQVGPDSYRTIYCRYDGYLQHNGALLLDHYNTPEKVDQLLALGDIESLTGKLEPDPSRPHGPEDSDLQKDVTVVYGRDLGVEGYNAQIMSLKQLDDPFDWMEFIYIFTEDNQWKYFETGQSLDGLRDVKEDLAAIYGRWVRPPECYLRLPRQRHDALVLDESTQAKAAPVYRDKNGIQIQEGMQIRFSGGQTELVYATMSKSGRPNLGINASNEDYMRQHNIPEAERKFYPLSVIDIRDVEVCEQILESEQENEAPSMQMM